MNNSEMPENLKGQVIIIDGVVHISDALAKDNHELLSFLSFAARKGFAETKRHPIKDFAEFYNKSKKAVSESEVQKMAVKILEDAREAGASDVHIADYGAFSTVQFRRMGMLEERQQLPEGVGHKLLSSMYTTMTDGADSNFSKTERQDGTLKTEYLPTDVQSVRLHTEPLKADMAKDKQGTFMAMRLLYDVTEATGSLEERMRTLGYTEQHISIFKYLSTRSGCVIFSGPTGSGKTTALKHAMESMAEENRDMSYMSLEDPPEFSMHLVKQIHIISDYTDEHNRAKVFRAALGGMLRSDIDGLMIGEMRYPEVVMAVLRAAQTGHSIWTSVHASSALNIIMLLATMLTDHGIREPRNYLCDHSICSGLINQRLVSVLCDHCKRPFTEIIELPEDDPERLRILPSGVFNRMLEVIDEDKIENVHFKGNGCKHCDNLGVVRQTVVAEVIATDYVMLEYLRKNDFISAHKHWINEQNGKSFVRHAIDLISEGKIDPTAVEKKLGVPLNYDKVFGHYSFNASDLESLSGSGSV
ncbi:ATPase, T2SS/T4P/T4SS family [Halodesulfovibrio sp.]|jgi:type II secretory ATPase GspE/PulE/Tfp pilus assembly ATPase PilB-like protein|uniref:ATPase, T2SS/T4P/T4SS family n=1 Tax=Halodesulfovibrio sp. TaxID=1912772 RepID=UPI0025D9C7DF|nr:ATPase, T2SS/T4P/T4SS family [Halodesulfovibrio sp.]MCT4533761.1 ATPase, T2SS/T4P/T4SS family [Halodesulfovibrio sp.]